MKDANGETIGQLLRSLIIVLFMLLTACLAILILAHVANFTINF